MAELSFSSDVNVVLDRNVPKATLLGSVSSGSGIKEIAYDIRMPNGKLPNGNKSYSSNFPTKVMLNVIITVTDRTGKKVRKALNWTYF